MSKKDNAVFIILDIKSKDVNELATFKGLRGFILEAWMDKCLVSIDNRVYLIKEGESQLILKANTQQHILVCIETKDKVFLREYEKPPTSIYISEDLVS